jgi:uncharacterized protein (DUF302 family)
MSEMSYTRQSVYGFEETVTAVLESARNAGWTVLATHDMRSRFQSKSIEWHAGFTIVEICKSGYAAAMVAAVPELALHLPCPVAIQADAEGVVRVSVLRPAFVTGLFPETDFGEAAGDAEAEVRSIVDHAVA